MFEELDRIQNALVQDLQYVGEADFKGHCDACQRPIISETASTYEQDGITHFFHSDCFKCAGCRMGLEEKSFFLHERGLYCEDCYHVHIQGLCSACNKPFLDPSILKAGEKQYHPQCFVCGTCRNPLQSQYVENEGTFSCKSCYEDRTLPTCDACNLKIYPDGDTGKVVAVEWKEKKYHMACFSCHSCKVPFQDLKALIFGQKFFCKSCYDQEVKKEVSSKK